jgi:tryptophan halogenase
MKNIIIVGGGPAGYISALILKTRFKDINIKIIKSNKIGIIGVGEGSTEHWKEFLRFVGINEYDLIKKTDATLKCGIMFKDWGKKDYLHSVVDELINLKCDHSIIIAS